jgi:hypothetical protein
MHLIGVRWGSPVNRLTVKCNCGLTIDWPANVSLVTCPRCRYAELWHSVDPKPASGPWSEPVMENRIRCR